MVSTVRDRLSNDKKVAWESMRTRNVLHIAAHSSDIRNSMLPLPEDVCLVVTGSDGRLERGFLSTLELIIINHGENAHGEIRNAVLNVREPDGSQAFSDNIEIKSLSSPDEHMVYAYGDQNRVYPQRILDGYLIAGNQFFFEQAALMAIRAFYGDSGTRILGILRDRVREYRKISETGQQRWKGSTVVHYDFDSGIAHYGIGEGELARSFKQGPLRFAQFALMQKVCAAARQNPGATKEILEALSKSTSFIERIQNLADAGFIPFNDSQIFTLTEIYLHFLILYHSSELAAKSKNPTIEFDSTSTKTAIQDLISIFREK